MKSVRRSGAVELWPLIIVAVAIALYIVFAVFIIAHGVEEDCRLASVRRVEFNRSTTNINIEVVNSTVPVRVSGEKVQIGINGVCKAEIERENGKIVVVVYERSR